MLSTISKSDATGVIFRNNSPSVTLSFIGFGLLVLLISIGVACGLSWSNVVFYDTVKTYKEHRKYFQKTKTIINSVDLSTKVFRTKKLIRRNMNLPFKIFNKYVDQNKNDSFFRIEVLKYKFY